MARILLIEDSPTDRAVFTQWLERGGHEVIPASKAEDGIDIARRTVAKYREALRIPSSVERRRMLRVA